MTTRLFWVPDFVHAALSASRAQATIGSLKKEIERAWKMVEASHEKEQRAKETIHNLKVPRAPSERPLQRFYKTLCFKDALV